MSLHSRPVPAPKTPEHVTSNPPATQPATPEPRAPQPGGTQPSEGAPRPKPTPSPEARAELAAADAEAAARPWYRREPWFAVTLAAFVPMTAAVFAPEPARYPLIGLAALALVAGAALLVRQGVFQSHPGSEPDRE
jgi:hypothetical protein